MGQLKQNTGVVGKLLQEFTLQGNRLLGLTSLGRERIIIGKTSMMLVLSPLDQNPL